MSESPLTEPVPSLYHSSDFTIVKPLNSGSFGTAYYAKRISDGMDLCIKKISIPSSRKQKQIQREASILSQLNNPHIIKYYGTFIEGHDLCIVMEYAKQGSLADMISVCGCYFNVNTYSLTALLS